MSDPEIAALRQKLASRVRSDDYRQRRKDMDARALEYRIAADVTVEPVTANGVRAEWTSTPNDAIDAALMWLHGGRPLTPALSPRAGRGRDPRGPPPCHRAGRPPYTLAMSIS
jgi:hypothetical protein